MGVIYITRVACVCVYTYGKSTNIMRGPEGEAEITNFIFHCLPSSLSPSLPPIRLTFLMLQFQWKVNRWAIVLLLLRTAEFTFF